MTTVSCCLITTSHSMRIARKSKTESQPSYMKVNHQKTKQSANNNRLSNPLLVSLNNKFTQPFRMKLRCLLLLFYRLKQARYLRTKKVFHVRLKNSPLKFKNQLVVTAKKHGGVITPSIKCAKKPSGSDV